MTDKCQIIPMPEYPNEFSFGFSDDDIVALHKIMKIGQIAWDEIDDKQCDMSEWTEYAQFDRSANPGLSPRKSFPCFSVGFTLDVDRLKELRKLSGTSRGRLIWHVLPSFIDAIGSTKSENVRQTLFDLMLYSIKHTTTKIIDNICVVVWNDIIPLHFHNIPDGIQIETFYWSLTDFGDHHSVFLLKHKDGYEEKIDMRRHGILNFDATLKHGAEHYDKNVRIYFIIQGTR